MIYALENFNDMIEELKPFLTAHYEEVAMYQDKIELDPDYDLYTAMQDAGVLKVFTMRFGGGPTEKGALIGYNIFFVKEHPHYKQDIFAVNDIVYVDPLHRHGGDTPAFFEWCERQLKEEFDVHVITYHMKTMKTFHALMESIEMDHAEHMYMKYIG